MLREVCHKESIAVTTILVPTTASTQKIDPGILLLLLLLLLATKQLSLQQKGLSTPYMGKGVHSRRSLLHLGRKHMATYYKDEQITYLPMVGPFRIISKAMRLDQRWAMFNNPISEDGWYENTGILRNNATLDLMGWGGPIPKKLRFPFPEDYLNPTLLPQSSLGKDRPEWFSRRFASQRWRKFLPYLRQKKHKNYRREYGKYICRMWNGRGYKEDNSDLGQLITFKLRFYPEPLVCDHERDTEGHKTGFCKNKKDVWVLWTHKCF